MKDKTLIFDLDGTLVDARELHHASFEWALKQQDKDFLLTQELKEKLEGKSSINKVILLNEIGYNFDVMLAYKQKQEHTNLHMHMLKWHPGIPAILDKLSETYNMAIASNARSEFVYGVISLMGITKFDIILSANFAHVDKRKPDPFLFNKAMTLLSADSATTTIFEDSDTGIKAAEDSDAQYIVRVNCSDDTYEHLEKLI